MNEGYRRYLFSICLAVDESAHGHEELDVDGIIDAIRGVPGVIGFDWATCEPNGECCTDGEGDDG